ncbi:MAG: glycosyltransferase 87 family protein [Candidatus Dormibacteria bacterium]
MQQQDASPSGARPGPAPAAAAPARTRGPSGRWPLRRLGWLAAAIALVQLAVALLAELRVPAGRERGIDISASYVAAGLWRNGLGDHLYDQRLEAAGHAAINAPGYRTDLPFITPPLTAVVTAPARLLGPDAGLRTLSALAVGALLVAVVVAARAAPGGAGSWRRLAVVLSVGAVPTLPLLLMGQWDGLCAAGLAGAYAAWRRDRALLAGLALAVGIGLAKPHLGLGLAAFVVGRRDARAALGALAGAGGLVLASLVLVGPRACIGFAGALRLSLAHSPPASTLGGSGFAASWLGDGGATAVLTAALAIAAVLGAGWLGARSRRRRMFEPCLAGATALSLFATPHLLGHDLVVLAPAFVWVAGWAVTKSRSEPIPRMDLPAWLLGAWLLFDLAAFADLGNAAPAPPGRLVPLVLLAAAAWAFRVSREAAGQSGRGRARGGVESYA